MFCFVYKILLYHNFKHSFNHFSDAMIDVSKKSSNKNSCSAGLCFLLHNLASGKGGFSLAPGPQPFHSWSRAPLQRGFQRMPQRLRQGSPMADGHVDTEGCEGETTEHGKNEKSGSWKLRLNLVALSGEC